MAETSRMGFRQDRQRRTTSRRRGGSFAISSLKGANASWDPKGGHDVVITAFRGDGEVGRKTVAMQDIEKPRTDMEIVSIARPEVTEVRITSETMFSIDDIAIDDTVIDFEGTRGEKPTNGVGYVSSLYYDPGRALPISMINPRGY